MALSEYDPGSVARQWWRALQSTTANGEAKPGDRAALARLRRSGPAGTATAEEATMRLFRDLGYTSHEALPRVAALACVLANVREDDQGIKFARAIGRPDFASKDGAALKLIRFQRLIEARGEEEIARGLSASCRYRRSKG